MEKNGKKEEAKYKFPSGTPIKFYTEPILDFLQTVILPISDFGSLLKASESEDSQMAARIIEDLCSQSWEKLEERIEFIEENLGEISIDLKDPDEMGPEFLGLNFIPKSKGQN